MCKTIVNSNIKLWIIISFMIDVQFVQTFVAKRVRAKDIYGSPKIDTDVVKPRL